jgi:YVTN family beta-propeller protein
MMKVKRAMSIVLSAVMMGAMILFTSSSSMIHAQADSQTQLAYVANVFSDTLSVIDTQTNTVVDTIATKESPSAIAITPNGKRIYAIQRDSVSAIDTKTKTVMDIALENFATAIAISPDGEQAYVVSREGRTLSIIDTVTNTVIDTIHMGTKPIEAVAFTPNGKQAYVTSRVTNATNRLEFVIFVVDTQDHKVVDTIRVGNPGILSAIAITLDGKWAYIKASKEVLVIDTETHKMVGTIKTNSTLPPGATIALSPDGTQLYIPRVNDVYVVSTQTGEMIEIIPIKGKGYPMGIAILPNGARVYVTDYKGNTVSVIDPETCQVESIISVGNTPYSISIAPSPD